MKMKNAFRFHVVADGPVFKVFSTENKDPHESYEFQTREWADFACRQLNKLVPSNEKVCIDPNFLPWLTGSLSYSKALQHMPMNWFGAFLLMLGGVRVEHPKINKLQGWIKTFWHGTGNDD